MKILIIDDSKLVTSSIFSILNRYEVEVQIAHTYSEVLDLAKSNQFDLAFIDVKMPVINGIELAKSLKKSNTIKYLVMMTGVLAPSFSKLIPKLDPLDTILKPVNVEHINKILKKIDPNLNLTKQLPLSSSVNVEEFSDIIFNASDGLKRFSDDINLFVQQLQNFLIELDKTIIEFFEYSVFQAETIDPKTQSMFHFKIHNLKGNAEFIGASYLASEAKILNKIIFEDKSFTIENYHDLRKSAELTALTIRNFISSLSVAA